MCLIFVAINQHPDYKLIVAGNRDEFYNRQTAAANWWEEDANIVGGRDLQAGGTWMGMTRTGKISMLTNYRDPYNINPVAPSRGHIVSDFLHKEATPEQYIHTIEQRAKEYNGFNLINGTVDELWYLSNYKDGVVRLENKLYGLSNHLLDSPWPKVERGKRKLTSILQQPTVTSEQLFEFLYDSEPAADNLLPDTGIGLERERSLSSMFIKTPNYGSRCSTTVLVDKRNHVVFSERVYNLTTFEFTTSTYEFDVR